MTAPPLPRMQSQRRFLALVLPLLPSERLLATRQNAPPDAPFALTEKIRGARVIAALDPHALALGLVPGLKLADARARVPELLAFDHAPQDDAAMLDRLALACERYTPMVATVPPDALILDIGGAAHFFDSETALARDAEDRFDRAGHHARWAFGTTAQAALALARYGLAEGAEAQLPVAALELDTDRLCAIERAGLTRIGDLASRPRETLAARFGEDAMARLDLLLGRGNHPIDPLRRLATIRTERRFAEPLTSSEAAQRLLAELFGEAADHLEQRGEGARMVTMRLFRCDGDVASLTVETGAPTRDAKLFERLLAEKIDALDDPLNPGFGYDLIRLTIARAEPLAVRQLALEGGEDGSADLAALKANLSARLGRGAVRVFAPADSHIPEQGLLSLPALAETKAVAWKAKEPDNIPKRPLHLFDPPQRISVIAEVPDGPPHRFTWRRKTHRVTRYEGPERIASEWWTRPDGQQPGKGGLTRDYFCVEDDRGRRYWLFRHGLFGSEQENPDWYLHGLFA